jgi:hypothetical protein
MAAAGRTVQHSLTVGTPVEVWNRFESSFVPGFEVSDDVENGYRLRRTSDGVELPVTFSAEDVREIAHTS